jgi:hypothetical protein
VSTTHFTSLAAHVSLGGQERTSGVAQVSATKAALLADLAKHRPRFAHGAAVAAIFVRLTKLATLVLKV